MNMLIGFFDFSTLLYAILDAIVTQGGSLNTTTLFGIYYFS